MRPAMLFAMVGALTLAISCAPKQTVKKSKLAKIEYKDSNSGNSIEDAVVITKAKDQTEIVGLEYDFISRQHGKKGKDWILMGQTVQREGDKTYDILELQLPATSQTHYHYFDITGCKLGQLIHRESETITTPQQ
jgi:hypothetical protein